MPESPRFLVSQKKFKEAREVFKWIGLKNGLTEKEIDQRLSQIQFEGETILKNYLQITDDKNKNLRKQMRENQGKNTRLSFNDPSPSR